MRKTLNYEELRHELFLTTRQTKKIRNAFANNVSWYKNRYKFQISEIIQAGGSFGSWLDNSGLKALKYCYSFS